MGQLFLFTYYQAYRDLRLGSRPFESQIHKIRDGLASGILIELAATLGLSYAGPILNIPREVRQHVRIQASEPVLKKDDLLLMVTRPPLDDDPELAKRTIQRSFTQLEGDVIEALRTFFKVCHRSVVVLQDNVSLTDDRYRAIQFHQSKGGFIKRLDALRKPRPPQNERLTLGYLVSLPEISRTTRARMVAAFGMGGTETLLFAYMLRNREALKKCYAAAIKGEITKKRIVIAEFRVANAVPSDFLHYDAEQLDARIVVDVRL